jgi:hypothetical protein
MNDHPCDILTCINRIPHDEWQRCVDEMLAEGVTGLIICGDCTPAPEGHWYHDLAEAPIEDILDAFDEAIKATQ